ncbi:MAG: DUF596 domain-containing protein [Acinetobacter sp.]
MNIVLNEKRINRFLINEDIKYHDFGWLWTSLDFFEDLMLINTSTEDSFNIRKELFFNIIKYLMMKNELKIANKSKLSDQYLSENYVDLYHIFPKSEEEANKCTRIGGVNIWLILEEYCPFWPVWVDIDETGNEKLWWAE